MTEVAKQIFDTDITMTLTERRTGQVFLSKFCEHVTFEVKVIGKDNGMGMTEAGKENKQSVVIDTGIKQPDNMDDKTSIISMKSSRIFLAMPYSVIFDKNMHILGAGLHLKTICPEVERPLVKFNDIFEIKEPKLVFTYENIMNCSNTHMYFFLQVKRGGIANGKEKADCPVLRGISLLTRDRPFNLKWGYGFVLENNFLSGNLMEKSLYMTWAEKIF